MEDAIKVHSDWKLKLKAYLSKPDGSLMPAQLGVDNACKLGQWLHGEGKKHSALPEYSALVAEHARFHKAAAGVIEKANSGQDVSEETALGANSEFATASRKLVNAVQAAQKKMAAA